MSGTMATISESVQRTMAPGAAPNNTLDRPWVEPKFAPRSEMVAETVPRSGMSASSVGASSPSPASEASSSIPVEADSLVSEDVGGSQEAMLVERPSSSLEASEKVSLWPSATVDALLLRPTVSVEEPCPALDDTLNDAVSSLVPSFEGGLS